MTCGKKEVGRVSVFMSQLSGGLHVALRALTRLQLLCGHTPAGPQALATSDCEPFATSSALCEGPRRACTVSDRQGLADFTNWSAPTPRP
jgi:hypothetical protein